MHKYSVYSICHRIDYPRLIHEVSQVLVMFSGKNLHCSIPMMSSMTSQLICKAI